VQFSQALDLDVKTIYSAPPSLHCEHRRIRELIVNTAIAFVATARPLGRVARACACAMPTVGKRCGALHSNASSAFQRLDRFESRGDPGEGFA
jgi:hypothetical protein